MLYKTLGKIKWSNWSTVISISGFLTGSTTTGNVRYASITKMREIRFALLKIISSNLPKFWQFYWNSSSPIMGDIPKEITTSGFRKSWILQNTRLLGGESMRMQRLGMLFINWLGRWCTVAIFMAGITLPTLKRINSGITYQILLTGKCHLTKLSKQMLTFCFMNSCINALILYYNII